MKKSFLIAMLLGWLTVSLSACDVVMDIFNTGVWVGVMIVLLVIFLIFYFLNKGKNKTGA